MVSLHTPRLTLRRRLHLSPTWNGFLDLLIRPVLKRATFEEYHGSSTRRELVAKFIRNRI